MFIENDKRLKDINIVTERLVLRSLKSKDITEDYVNWLNDPKINKYLSCANVPQTYQTCLEYVESYQEKDDAALIGIFLKKDMKHIGNLTLSSIDWQEKMLLSESASEEKDAWEKGLQKKH